MANGTCMRALCLLVISKVAVLQHKDERFQRLIQLVLSSSLCGCSLLFVVSAMMSAHLYLYCFSVHSYFEILQPSLCLTEIQGHCVLFYNILLITEF